MKNYKLSAIVGLSALMVLASGCAKSPQTELDAARTTLAQAETANAATYAPEQWEAARTALTEAEAEIATQNAKFALGRSFETARQQLTDATSKATAAAQAAETAKEETRVASVQSFEAAQASIAQTDTLLAELGSCGQRPKGFDLDLVALRGQVDGLTAEAPSIQQAIDSQDYTSAQTRAESISSRAVVLIGELQTAMQRLKCQPTAAA